MSLRVVSGNVEELLRYWVENGTDDPNADCALNTLADDWVDAVEPMVRHAQSAFAGNDGDFAFSEPGFEAIAQRWLAMSNGERFAIALKLACYEVLDDGADEALRDAADVIADLSARLEAAEAKLQDAA